MKQEYIDLYDEYTHTPLSRRVFLRRLARLAGGAAAAAALVPLLEANYAAAGIVASNDKRLYTQTVSYPGPQGDVKGYLAMPREGGKYPAVVVIHENRGLNPHIKDVARRLALAGIVAMAPDALSPLGGTPADPDEARNMIRSLDKKATLDNYIAAVTAMKSHPSSTGKVGCVGFCWGGGMSKQLAVHSGDLNGAVAFYGRTPDSKDVPMIRIPILLHYAGLDQRINKGIPDYNAALDKAGARYTMHMYEGVNHAFHNDTAEARYNLGAAGLAWGRTVNFLLDTLGG